MTVYEIETRRTIAFQTDVFGVTHALTANDTSPHGSWAFSMSLLEAMAEFLDNPDYRPTEAEALNIRLYSVLGQALHHLSTTLYLLRQAHFKLDERYKDKHALSTEADIWLRNLINVSISDFRPEFKISYIKGYPETHPHPYKFYYPSWNADVRTALKQHAPTMRTELSGPLEELLSQHGYAHPQMKNLYNTTQGLYLAKNLVQHMRSLYIPALLKQRFVYVHPGNLVQYSFDGPQQLSEWKNLGFADAMWPAAVNNLMLLFINGFLPFDDHEAPALPRVYLEPTSVMHFYSPKTPDVRHIFTTKPDLLSLQDLGITYIDLKHGKPKMTRPGTFAHMAQVASLALTAIAIDKLPARINTHNSRSRETTKLSPTQKPITILYQPLKPDPHQTPMLVDPLNIGHYNDLELKLALAHFGTIARPPEVSFSDLAQYWQTPRGIKDIYEHLSAIYYKFKELAVSPTGIFKVPKPNKLMESKPKLSKRPRKRRFTPYDTTLFANPEPID